MSGHKSFVEICGQNKVAQVTNCDGSTTSTPVDSVVGAYLINQNDRWEQTYNDVLGCTIGGIIPTSVTTLTTLNVSLNTVTIINDNVLTYIVDYGNGHVDYIASGISTYNYINQPIGKYEIRVYASMASGNILLVKSAEYDFNGTSLTYVSDTVVSRTYQRLVSEFVQRYCGNVKVGSPINFNGNYTLVGTGNINKPFIFNDLKVNNDLTLGTSATATPVVTPLENASQNRLVGVLANGSVTNTNPTFSGARDVTIYNGKNITIAFEYTSTINGTFHRVNIPRGGTWSNTLKRDDYTNEGTYVLGRVVAAYGATTAANEININWTT